jgi:universal stress protein A
MHINKILCPIDFSDFNQAANEYACILAKSTGAEIVYLHASLPLATTYGSYGYIDMDEEAQRDQKRLEKIKPTIDDIKASHEIRFGTPAVMIVDFANEHDVDLIVMGTHGRTGVRRVVMGSVAEAVVRRAKCPVLAIKSAANVPQLG